MAAVGTGVGGNVDAQLVGAFLKRVGEQCRGAGASAQNQNPQILALKGGRSCGGLSGRSGLDNRSLNGGGGSGLDGLGLLGLFFGQGLGLLLAQDVVVGLAERVVDQEVNDQQDDNQDQRDRLEVGVDEGADRSGECPRHGIDKAVHAQKVDEELTNEDVGHGGKQERDQEVRVEDDGRGEQQRLVDGEHHGYDRGFADGLELLGAHKEQEDDRDNERGAGAAEFADVVTEVLGQGEGGVTAGLQRGEVGGDVAKQRGVEGRLNDRGAVDAHEPEQRDHEPDEGEAGVGIGSGEQRAHQRGDDVGKRDGQAGAADNVDDGDKQDGEAEGEDVAEVLGDGAGDFFGQLDGDVSLNAEGIDVDRGKCGDKGAQQALGAHVVGKEHRDIGAVDLGTRLGNGQDEHSAHGGDHGARGVDGLAGRHAAVLGAGQRACGGAGDHDAHDAHREVVNLVAEVHDVDVPPVGQRKAADRGDNARQGRNKQEDRRRQDDGHCCKKAVFNGLKVDVLRDLVEVRLTFLQELNDRFHSSRSSLHEILMAWTLKTYMVSRLLKARVQAGSVPGGERGAAGFVSHRAAPFSGESEAMRYCASAIVSASSLYQSADCLM